MSTYKTEDLDGTCHTGNYNHMVGGDTPIIGPSGF